MTRALLLALCLGCSLEPTEQRAAIDAPARCSIAMNAEPAGLWSEAQSVSWRVHEATGCVVQLRSDGFPVTGGEPRVMVEKKMTRVCGHALLSAFVGPPATVAFISGIQIDTTGELACFDLEGTLLHEVLHTLANPAGAVPDMDDHASSGVFTKWSNPTADASLTADTLTTLCARADCLWFNPE